MTDDLKLVADEMVMLAEMQLDTPTRGMWLLLLHSANHYEDGLNNCQPPNPPGEAYMREAIAFVKALPWITPNE